jgi:hypothetical protein
VARLYTARAEQAALRLNQIGEFSIAQRLAGVGWADSPVRRR